MTTTTAYTSEYKVAFDADYAEWTVVNAAGEIEDYFKSEKAAERGKKVLDREAEREFLVSEIELDDLSVAQLRAIMKMISK